MKSVFLSKNFDIFPDNAFVVALVLIYFLLLVWGSLSCIFLTALNLFKQDKRYHSAFLKWLCGAVILWIPFFVVRPDLMWIPFVILFILTIINFYLYRRNKKQDNAQGS
jgi:predicted membrane protein